MPKETFLNLPIEKKTHMEEILLHTFYDRHVSQVKVAEIVEAMQMSRGAFYKYFRDLEDAYTYIIRKYTNAIHGDILKHMDEDKKDFFGGIERYLSWCSKLDHDSEYWRSIQLLTRGKNLAAYRRVDMPPDSPIIKQWTDLLELNGFRMANYREALSFLYFSMALVMDALTDFVVNEWSTQELITDFRYKSRWLTEGLR